MPKVNTIRDAEIVRLYVSGDMLTIDIARRFNIKRRRVLQIVEAAGVFGNQKEGTIASVPLRSKRRLRRRYLLK